MAASRYSRRSILSLALLSLVTGALTGLLVAMFRLALQGADRWRNALIAGGHHWPVAGLLLTIALVAAASALAALLVRRFSPYAGGSGIPHVEAVAKGELPPAPLSLIPVKFLGGLLAIELRACSLREGSKGPNGRGYRFFPQERNSTCPIRLYSPAGRLRRIRNRYGIQCPDRWSRVCAGRANSPV